MLKTSADQSGPVKTAKSMSMEPASTSSPSMKVTKYGNSPSKKKSTSLPPETVDYLKAWMMSPEHIAHPYPTEQEKSQIMAETGIELKQLTNWFVNNRKRYWKPRVEARLQHQVQLPVAPAPTATSALPLKRKTSPQLAPCDLTDRSLNRFQSRVGSAAAVSVEDEGFKFGRSNIQDNLNESSSAAACSKSPSGGPQVLAQFVVSDASSSGSCASDTASVVSSGNEDELANFDSSEDVVSSGSVARTETVDVHILRPINGVKPTIADVSILATVPSERILCTYENVMLTYRFTIESIQDRKKVQNRRDAEIARLKRKYLKHFVEEVYVVTAAPAPVTTTAEVRSESESTPRKKFRRESLEMWKEACGTAQDIYDRDLPTLEEATLLFGFSRGISA